MPRSRPDTNAFVNTALESLPDVMSKRMFGARAFFTRDRMFAFLVDQAVVLKLPEPARQEVLAERIARPFLTGDHPAFGRWVEIGLRAPESRPRVLELARLAYQAAQSPDREGPRKRRVGSKRRKALTRRVASE
jgi:TfoX/Sxy family transcriptional regulator of competence genes